MNILEKAKMMRWIVSNSHTYMMHRNKKRKNNKQTAWFDLRKNVFHRYLLDLMLMLEDQGYSISVKLRPAFLGSWHTSLLIRSIPNLRFHLHAHPKDQDLRFSDTDRNGHGIFLDPNIFRPEVERSAYKVPMPMVDSIYTKSLHEWQPDLKSLGANRKIFFVGNISPEYSVHSSIIEGFFNCFSRIRLIQMINQHFSERIHSPINFHDLYDNGIKDIILIDRKIFNIPHELLRPTMADHAFFLAPAGVIMPLCHNLTEAMSVGCIPILQHGHLLEPPLVHGHDCLSYSNEEELVHVIMSIPSLDERTIATMRGNVLSYYLDHLTPRAVVSAIRRSADEGGHIYLNAEHYSVQRALMSKRR